jgi:hypothetical protein
MQRTVTGRAIGTLAGRSQRHAIMATIVVASLAGHALAAEPPVRPDRPYIISFPAQEARFVRFVIHATNTGTPCIDELEAYGPDGKRNLALAKHGAKVSASSCITGHAIHRIQHLNDGQYGNDRSWIAVATDGEWAQIELPKPATVAKVVFSRDRQRHYADRVPTAFEVCLSMDGKAWRVVRKVSTKAAHVALRPKPSRSGPPKLPGAPPPLGAETRIQPGSDVAVPRRDERGFTNLALNNKATAAASSVLPGHAIHQIAHLNDGQAGNAHSWISKSDPSWAEIDLGDVYWVYRVAFASDNAGGFDDRAATRFKILTATKHASHTESASWRTVYKQTRERAVHRRAAFRFKPVQARWVRIAVDAANRNEVRIDEIEIYGQADPIPPDKMGPIESTVAAKPTVEHEQQLREAFLGEEHAWLKTYGRADLSPRLVPYNGRVKEYPRHVGDDRLPLPQLTGPPKLDGKPDDACWRGASRGVARVAWPYDFETSPCINHAVTAGWRGDDLYLAVQMDRVLSSHVAVVSSGDWQGCGMVVHLADRLVFRRFKNGRPEKSTRIDGAFDKERRCFEFRLPLSMLPGCRDHGVRVGLGMGGRHTPNHGREVRFAFSPLAIAEQPRAAGHGFRVRLSVPAGAESTKVHGDLPELADGLAIAPGQSKVIDIAAKRGPIGPEHNLTITDDAGEAYTLKLFRYDPTETTLRLMQAMMKRFAAKGLDVRTERE